jgi:hypothetical protein
VWLLPKVHWFMFRSAEHSSSSATCGRQECDIPPPPPRLHAGWGQLEGDRMPGLQTPSPILAVAKLCPSPREPGVCGFIRPKAVGLSELLVTSAPVSSSTPVPVPHCESTGIAQWSSTFPNRDTELGSPGGLGKADCWAPPQRASWTSSWVVQGAP